MAPRQRNMPSSASTKGPSFVVEESSSTSSDDTSTTSALLPSEEKKFLATQKTIKSKPPLTLNITESDIARDNHDWFNVVGLFFVVGSCAMNYEFPSGHYTGDYFWAMWTTTLIYFIIDLTWVALIPICVKSPGVIIKHHIVAILYMTGGPFYPQYRWVMGATLSVELNTWLLIVRRLVYRSCYCSSYRTAPPVITATVSTLFYITWIVIRCYLYPKLLFIFFDMWMIQIESTGQYLFSELMFIPVHAALCVLNFKWTYDLFKPIINRWMGTGPKSMVVQDGL